MNQIKISFQKGGELIADLNERAPETIKRILEILPLTSTMVHTRWCGREISCGISTKVKPPQENCTSIVSKFDVVYWRDWESEKPLTEAPAEEAIALYYGPELLRYHNGILRVNVFGRIKWEQEDLLETIGTRIWRHGIESVKIEIV
ncbi:DUF3830 family protein [Carboxydocella sp. ULO1]|uniref:DUF3830 family protein n=1 Tax=Carboxydocella sp. ULO1 TaxID=1926599 RepID=UPI0009ADBE9E|nr:DUF3830 family protein [Carboxydocella sp. ULO1]GAW28863.1 hypothetical protein ULO1_14330 [Carboxydocella sp. ULO1]